jgi:hypothetical protein
VIGETSDNLCRSASPNDHVRATEATSNDSTSSKVHRRVCYLASVHMRLVIFNLFLCSSTECHSPDAAASRRGKQVRGTRSGLGTTISFLRRLQEQCREQWHAHHDQTPATNKCRLICRVFFSSCDSVASRRQRYGHRPGHHDHVGAIEATSNVSTTPKVYHRVCYLASVHMRLVIFTLFFCSSAKWSSLDANDHVPATHSERRRGQRPRHHDQVPVTNSC